jgi:drug/metabolite transporter (DMT)-like permease
MKSSRRSIMDVGLLIVVNAMWAAQYSAYKVATEKMGPITVGAWTFLMAGMVLLPFLLWERRSSSALPSSAAATSPLGHSKSLARRKNIIGFLAIGIGGLIPASAFLAWGVDRSTASNAALIYLTVPIITAVLASIIVDEKMTLVRWGSLGISVVGVLILSDFNWRHLELASGKFLLGNCLVLVACTCSAFYNVYSKELLRRFAPLEVLVYGYFLALMVSIPLLVWVEPLTAEAVRGYGMRVWVALLILSGLSWGLAMVLWMFLLKRLDVSQASVSIYLLPFLGVLISAVTLHEKITPTMILGGAVTLAGTILITTLDATSA